MSIRIILADSQRILRQGIRSLLERGEDIEVVAEADDGRMAVSLAREMLPNIVVLDTVMPHLNSCDATRRIIAEAPGVRVLALSMDTDRRTVRQMLKAGAAGYVQKDCSAEELVDAIRSIANNQTYLGLTITNVVVADYVDSEETGPSVFSVLTTREREVLQLLAEGLSVKRIAHQLGLSTKTIETYRQQLMHKLGMHSIAELVKYAVREGLTSL